MEAFVGTAFLSSAIKDIYNSIKSTLSHNNDSLNYLYETTDILAKLKITESLVSSLEAKTNMKSVVIKIACEQVHESILNIQNKIEDINEDLINYNAKRFKLFGPGIQNKLESLERTIHTFDSRTNYLLKFNNILT